MRPFRRKTDQQTKKNSKVGIYIIQAINTDASSGGKNRPYTLLITNTFESKHAAFLLLQFLCARLTLGPKTPEALLSFGDGFG